jgi:hypothetical protein
MNATEEAGKVASGTVDALKSQPLALALVIVNVLYLIAFGYVAHDVANRMQARNERFDKILDQCLAKGNFP